MCRGGGPRVGEAGHVGVRGVTCGWGGPCVGEVGHVWVSAVVCREAGRVWLRVDHVGEDRPTTAAAASPAWRSCSSRALQSWHTWGQGWGSVAGVGSLGKGEALASSPQRSSWRHWATTQPSWRATPQGFHAGLLPPPCPCGGGLWPLGWSQLQATDSWVLQTGRPGAAQAKPWLWC